MPLDGRCPRVTAAEDLKAGFHVKVVIGEKHMISKIDAHSKSK
jgi:hypothetical protein